ncbi:MAG: YceI family protein [Bacteroidetes bacterium]|nr:YceI family protein [Bacteroidota bacterium]MBS1539272.1 YceI family protein [Bacteroidota bacterium]
MVLVLAIPSRAQKFSSDKSFIRFFSSAAIEDITAENRMGSSIFNEETGEVVFSVPIREFQFAESLMKGEFNQKYMESEKFPKAIFEGKITGYAKDVSSEQTVVAAGKLTIHGVTKNVEIHGSIKNENDHKVMKSKFIVKLEDYDVKVPEFLWQKIAEQVEVTVEFNYKSL